jgi:putative transposase
VWYHALNRGNRRAAICHKPGDYDAFVDAIINARARLPVDLHGYCRVPNHFHFVPVLVQREWDKRRRSLS